MTAEIILMIILNMLRMDNATPERINEAMPHLTALASAIAQEQDTDVPAVRLIALSYEESRFGLPYKGFKPVSSDNACGVYQQIPKWAYVEGATCARLNNDLVFATKAAKANLRYIQKRFAKTLRSSVIDDKMCHYYSGNKCDQEAHDYAKRHQKSRLKAISLAGAKASIKSAVVTSDVRVSDDPNSGLPPTSI